MSALIRPFVDLLWVFIWTTAVWFTFSNVANVLLLTLGRRNEGVDSFRLACMGCAWATIIVFWEH